MLENRVLEHVELLNVVFQAFDGLLRLDVGFFPFVQRGEVELFDILYFQSHHLVLHVDSIEISTVRPEFFSPEC